MRRLKRSSSRKRTVGAKAAASLRACERCKALVARAPAPIAGRVARFLVFLLVSGPAIRGVLVKGRTDENWIADRSLGGRAGDGARVRDAGARGGFRVGRLLPRRPGAV